MFRFRRRFKLTTRIKHAVKRAAGRVIERVVRRPLDWISPRTIRALVHPASSPAAQGELDEKQIARMELAEKRKLAAQRAVTRRRLERQLRKEAFYYKKVIPNQLNILGYSYRWKKDGRTRTMLVKFDRIVASEEAIYFHLDIRHLPWGVKLANLSDPDTLQNISAACQHSVTNQYRQACGFWYILERGKGVRGVPEEVTVTEVKLPENAAPLTFRLGLGENKQQHYFDLARAPHLLIGGATDSGKSVFVNQILCTLAERNNPDELKFIMVDLKVVELSFYHGLPHLDMPIITEKEDVEPVLDALYHEVRRRLDLFRGKCRNIVGWNQLRRKDKLLEFLPYKVLVIDEIANLMLDKMLKKRAETFLSDITAQARATGIHCILCTQRPEVKVVTGLIKANCPTRVAFACASDVDSRVIIDHSDAKGLQPRGRMIFMYGSTLTEIQAPLITDSQVARIVNRLRKGVGVAPRRADLVYPVTFSELELMLAYAKDNLGGSFIIDKMFADLKGDGNGIVQDKIKFAARFLEEKGYLSHPAGQMPRKVVRYPLSVADFPEIAPPIDLVIPDEPQIHAADVGERKNGDENKPEILQCPACGAALEPGQVECGYCGSSIK